MINRILSTACMVLLVYASGFTQDAGIIFSVAGYKNDKVCAISYTFDDGLKEHYTLVTPELKKLGFKATFWINGSKINQDNVTVRDSSRMCWGELREMAALGHEISNHGWAHKNFGRHSLDEIKEDIYKNDSAILANVGVMPRTFCYPNNTKPAEGVKLASENRVATRTFQRSVGSKSTDENLEQWVYDLLKSKDWGVTMTHGITYGYDHIKSAQVLWAHLTKVKTLEEKIWVASFRDVAAYLKEKEAFRYEVITKKNSILIKPSLALDSSLFAMPLTGVISGKNIRKSMIIQGKKTISSKWLDGKMLFDFDPFGGDIEVVIKRGKN